MKNAILRSVVLTTVTLASVSVIADDSVRPTSIHCDEYYTNMQKGSPAAVDLKYLDIQVQADGTYLAVLTDNYTPTASDVQTYPYLHKTIQYSGEIMNLNSDSTDDKLIISQAWKAKDRAGGDMNVDRVVSVDLTAKTASDVTTPHPSLLDQGLEVIGMSPQGGDYVQPGQFVNCVVGASPIPQGVVDAAVKSAPFESPLAALPVETTGAALPETK